VKYRRPKNAEATKGGYYIHPEVAKEITKEFLASQAAKESSGGTQIEAKGGAGNVTKEVLGAERHYSVSEKTDGAPGIASKDAGQGSDESGMPKRAEAPISAEELREPTASPKQFAANRQNAVKSTGPRTDAGKRKVGRNRAKWNLCAKDVVITEGEGKERIKDFEALRDGLYEYWNPTGAQEEILVDTLAATEWRERRIYRAELGEIRAKSDSPNSAGTCLEVQKLAHGLPSETALGTISRHEAGLDRKNDRTVNRLLELQRVRRENEWLKWMDGLKRHPDKV